MDMNFFRHQVARIMRKTYTIRHLANEWGEKKWTCTDVQLELTWARNDSDVGDVQPHFSGFAACRSRRAFGQASRHFSRLVTY